MTSTPGARAATGSVYADDRQPIPSGGRETAPERAPGRYSVDAGQWRGPTTEEWLARIELGVSQLHAGALPIGWRKAW